MSDPETQAKHPRLYFGAEDLEALRAKRSADPLAKAAWDRVEALAAEAMECPPVEWQPRWEWDKGESGLESLGGALGKRAHLAGHLAFVSLMTGNQRMARKAADLTLSVCGMDYWTSPAFFQPPYDPPWRGTLETAGIAQWMGMAYDWLFDGLSPEERDRIRLNISYKGIMPLIQDWADSSTRLPIATHIKPWGNWWVNCIAPAGIAALAIFGEERTRRWETGWPLERPKGEEESLSLRWVRLAKQAMDWFWRFEGGTVPRLEKELFWDPEGTYYPANFDSEGSYAEGLNYLDAVMFHSFRFSDAYLRILGEEILPLELMKKVADFILETCYIEEGRMRAANLDDTRANHATNPQLTAFLARKLRHPGMQWYLHESRDNFNDDSMFKSGESPVFTFLWYDPGLAPREPSDPAPARVFPGNGWAVMRSGWGRRDGFFALKCGNTSGHAHADAGSYILHHAGKPLVIDSGTSSYVIPEWHTYYHTTRAHSTIMVGGKGQVKRLAGRITGWGGVGDCGLVAADATAPYEGALSRFIRRVAYLGKRCYVIVDELAKTDQGPFEWLLHFDGDLTELEGSFLISNGESRLLVQMAEPERFISSIEQGFKATPENFTRGDTPEQKRAALLRGEYLKVSPEEDEKKQTFFTVLYPFISGENPPEVSVLRERKWVGVRLARDGVTDLVVFRGHGARSAGLEGIWTDGKFAALTMDQKGKVISAMLDAGTTLKVSGKTIRLRKAHGTVCLGAGL